MRLRLVRWLFRRLGNRFWIVYALAQGGACVGVGAVTILIAARFFRPATGDVVAVIATSAVFTMLTITYAVLRNRAPLRSFWRWRADPDPDPAATIAVWHECVTGTWRTYVRYNPVIVLGAIVPAVSLAAWRWHAGWAGLAAFLLAALVPAWYGSVVSYTIGELLVRPMLEELAARMPDEFVLTPGGISMSRRLKVALPAYTTTAAMLTVGLVGNFHGAGALALTALVSAAVGIALATELTVLLGDSITNPVRHLRAQLERVREGDFTARTPVLSADEMGLLARDTNAMARGLAEREEIRDAFGTYMDRSVVDLILSGAFPPEGVETQASMLFCDVRGFTSYAETATAPEVIATLNELFSTIVPIVERHGGHVDKFLGDGLLAVFGTPDGFVDHADRAVAAACEIARVVSLGAVGLSVGVGVNTGVVVAGPLGGAGRLNFSVIGDAVNVAARVEAATRQTGDAVLITDATRLGLTDASGLQARGAIELKGKTEPVHLFAPDVTVRSRV